jgi:hypothetical protein
MSCGANDPDMFRLGADQTVKIFEGVSPGDVPALQAIPTTAIAAIWTPASTGLFVCVVCPCGASMAQRAGECDALALGG